MNKTKFHVGDRVSINGTVFGTIVARTRQGCVFGRPVRFVKGSYEVMIGTIGGEAKVVSAHADNMVKT